MSKKHKYRVHPAAELFPMLTQSELDALANDIQTYGLRNPIILTRDGQLLDGRNRLEACTRAGVDPKFKEWDHKGSPTAFVLSTNLRRRHLTESQAALVAATAIPLFTKEAKERQRAAGGDRRSVTAPGRQAIGGKGTAADAAAAAVGIGGRSVERAKALLERAPREEIEAIRRGEKTLKQVERETKHAQQVAQVRVYLPPEGEFPVIVIDPPWSYDDKLEGSDRVRGGCPYPTMDIDQISGMWLPVPKVGPCSVFLWVTNSHLIDPDAYGVVVKHWRSRFGVVPKQIRTWKKPEMGVGHVWRNDTEHLVRLERGSPVYNKVTQRTFFEGQLGEHSEKPQRAYDDIEALCPAGPKLEMFARAPRAGWITSGAELKAPEPCLPPARNGPPPSPPPPAPPEHPKKRARLRITDLPTEAA